MGIKLSTYSYRNKLTNVQLGVVNTGIQNHSGANDTTIIGGRVGSATTGMSIDNCSNILVDGTHFEMFTTGITIAPSATVTSPKIIGGRFENSPTSGTGIVLGNVASPTLIGPYFQGLSTNIDFGSNSDVFVLGAYTAADNRLVNLTGNGVVSFSANDATPSVQHGVAFKTANTVGTTITTFDNGAVGQIIWVIFDDGNTVLDFTGTNLKGNGGADWSPAAGDHMNSVFDGTNWNCSVSDNTS
jgi:hypothetical protein